MNKQIGEIINEIINAINNSEENMFNISNNNFKDTIKNNLENIKIDQKIKWDNLLLAFLFYKGKDLSNENLDKDEIFKKLEIKNLLNDLKKLNVLEIENNKNEHSSNQNQKYLLEFKKIFLLTFLYKNLKGNNSKINDDIKINYFKKEIINFFKKQENNCLNQNLNNALIFLSDKLKIKDPINAKIKKSINDIIAGIKQSLKILLYIKPNINCNYYQIFYFLFQFYKEYIYCWNEKISQSVDCKNFDNLFNFQNFGEIKTFFNNSDSKKKFKNFFKKIFFEVYNDEYSVSNFIRIVNVPLKFLQFLALQKPKTKNFVKLTYNKFVKLTYNKVILTIWEKFGKDKNSEFFVTDENYNNLISNLKLDIPKQKENKNTSNNLDVNETNDLITKNIEYQIKCSDDINYEIPIKNRQGQSTLRKNILEAYNNTCILSGINCEEILITSHIKPWNMSDDKEKGYFYNCIPLSANIDKLFDKKIISFDNNGFLQIDKNFEKTPNYKDILEKCNIFKDLIDGKKNIFDCIKKYLKDKTKFNKEKFQEFFKIHFDLFSQNQ